MKFQEGSIVVVKNFSGLFWPNKGPLLKDGNKHVVADIGSLGLVQVIYPDGRTGVTAKLYDVLDNKPYFTTYTFEVQDLEVIDQLSAEELVRVRNKINRYLHD
jgi:hypothetical protein